MERPFPPDLKQVLGNYYDQVLAVAKNRRTSHNTPISIHEPGLVVEMSGHMRYYTGRAYVPSMLPAGEYKPPRLSKETPVRRALVLISSCALSVLVACGGGNNSSSAGGNSITPHLGKQRSGHRR